MSHDSIQKLLISRLAGLAFSTAPWEHAEQGDFLPLPLADALAEAFNSIELERHEADRETKPYRLYNRSLPAFFDAPIHEWQRIANALQGPEYRAGMERLARRDLSKMTVTLDMWAYGPGDWLGPHQDDPGKIMTQILYLTPGWAPDSGGRMAILTGKTMESVVRYVTPSYGGTVIFPPSPRSWHGVEPIAEFGLIRRSMTLTYWRKEKRNFGSKT